MPKARPNSSGYLPAKAARSRILWGEKVRRFYRMVGTIHGAPKYQRRSPDPGYDPGIDLTYKHAFSSPALTSKARLPMLNYRETCSPDVPPSSGGLASRFLDPGRRDPPRQGGAGENGHGALGGGYGHRDRRLLWPPSARYSSLRFPSRRDFGSCHGLCHRCARHPRDTGAISTTPDDRDGIHLRRVLDWACRDSRKRSGH